MTFGHPVRVPQKMNSKILKEKKNESIMFDVLPFIIYKW